MTSDRRARLGVLICGLMVYLFIAAIPLGTELPSPAWPWWVTLAVLAGAYAAFAFSSTIRWGVLAVLVVATWALPNIDLLEGLASIPTTVCIAVIAGVARTRFSFAVLALNCVALTVAYWWQSGLEAASISVPLYGLFQLFTMFTMTLLRREEEARRDATEAQERLSEAHEELRAAQAEALRASKDEERLRISRDLHDSIGHQLTSLAVTLEVAQHKVAADSPGGEEVARAREVAGHLLGDVRDVVSRLREDRGALAARLDDMAEAAPLDVALTTEGDVDGLTDVVAEAVERCVQEAITNTVRHSGASRLDVAVAVDDAGVRVVAADDGRGAADLAPGNGLVGMHERITAIGGTLTVEPDAAPGFRIEARMPAAPPAADRAPTEAPSEVVEEAP